MAGIYKYTVWIYVGCLCLLQNIIGTAGLSVSACFNTSQKALEMNCGAGYMLRVRASFYGYSYRGACGFTPGDCTQAEHEQYPCMGRESCRINLPSGNFGQKIPTCDKYSTYFQVEYECEPVAETHDICRTSRLTSQRGYISTSNYPNNYRNNQDCVTQISVNPDQKINLTIIDMDLEMIGSSSGCEDWMYSYNKERSITVCGSRTNEKLDSLQSSEITIHFQSNRDITKKGFWIYYEAYPPLVTTTPYKATPSNIPRTKRITLAPAIAPTAAPTTTKTQEKLPFVAIVSGVIGTLTFILIVLLVMLGVKWWHEKKHTSYKRDSKDIEYLDARNPAFRSSTGTEFQGVEIYYNC